MSERASAKLTQGGVTVICGGVGAARFLEGLVQVVEPARVTGIVNTGDDMRLHGLAISPDLDTCTYTLADAINRETGWGLVGETWNSRDMLERYGGQTWFGLGDRDLGTHLYRTQRLDDGAPLSVVTSEIIRAWDLALHLVPMSDDPVRTRITIENGETIDFQRYFVERGHQDHVVNVSFEGISQARPAPGTLDAIASASCIVIAPSNPFVSIAPVLGVPGMRDALIARRDSTVCISPIVGASALKGPAAELMRTLGHEVSAAGVARIVADVAKYLVIDTSDAHLAPTIARAGVTAVVTDTIMRTPEVAAALATTAIQAATPSSTPAHPADPAHL